MLRIQAGVACGERCTHRDIVADKVPVALLGVELDGEATRVAQPLRRA